MKVVIYEYSGQRNKILDSEACRAWDNCSMAQVLSQAAGHK